ncbi:sigma-70 family RNA polymerase sigma factor [Dactylosporangium sp. CS-047395]|uniref:sigma-70 family RNA polymerase sigma factor n=1 Tax=Dactylosporangium sp. CS-047395 TaxID=3239936 RepID=UPI003D90628B
MELSLTVSIDGSRHLLALTGVLDVVSAPYLRQAIFQQLDAGATEVIVDATGLRLLDASSVKVLQYLRHRGERDGIDIHLAGVGHTTLQTLEILGVAKQLGAYRTVDWPRNQPRTVVSLEELRAGTGRFPPQATERLAALHALHPDDPARQRARESVIEACLPTAYRFARRYHHARESYADLQQVAALGLVKAIDGYDPERGIEFAAYATPTITGELKRYFRDRTSAVRLPRPLHDLRLAIHHTRDTLHQTLRREPTVADLAEHLDVGQQQILDALAAGNAVDPLSLNAPSAGGGSDDVTLAETIADDVADYELVESRQALRIHIAQLPVREQRILELRFYGNLSQRDIAEQVGMSQMHVSRLLAHSLTFLRRRLTS